MLRESDAYTHHDEDAVSWRPGLNPDFVRRVQEKRRAEAALAKQEHLREAKRREIVKQAARALATPKPAKQEKGRVDLERVRRTTTFERIVYRMCLAYNVTPAEIKSEKRNKDIVIARQAISYWACRLTSMSLPAISRLLGGRDHTTILHGKNVYPVKRAKMGRHLPRAR